MYGLYGFFFKKLYGLYGFLLKMYGFLYGWVQKSFGHPANRQIATRWTISEVFDCNIFSSKNAATSGGWLVQFQYGSPLSSSSYLLETLFSIFFKKIFLGSKCFVINVLSLVFMDKYKQSNKYLGYMLKP